MDPVTATIIVELTRTVLTTLFTFAKTKGATPEELEDMFQKSWAEVKKRDPKNLIDV